MHKLLKTIFILIGAGFFVSLYGCASGANSGAMAINAADRPLAINEELKEKTSVRNVGGGKETNPMLASQVDSNSFRSALSQSLRLASYEAIREPLFFIDAEIQALSQPLFGLTFDVTSTVRYTVEGQGKRKIFPITAVGTATPSDSLLGVERLKIANEKSIKENIKKFITELSWGL
jgi:hypothetical protein